MLVSPNLARWIKASVTKFFMDRNDAANTANSTDYYMFVDGDDRTTDGMERFTEFRTSGPVIREPCKNNFVVKYWINILIQSNIDAKDAYAFERIFGHAQSLFERCIPVIRYGNGPDDDQTQVGVLILQNSREIEELNGSNFGVVSERTRLQQGSAEGYYKMEFTQQE